MASDQHPVERRAGATRLLTELWAPRTWRETRYLATGGVIGTGGAVLLVPLLAATLLLVPTVVGAVVAFAAALAVGHALTWMQRRRLGAFLGRDLLLPTAADAASGVGRLLDRARRIHTWRQLGYHALGLPLGALMLTVVVLGWSWGPLLVPAVAYGPALLGVPTLICLALSVAGLALTLAAPWAVRVVAAADAELAVRLLSVPADEVLSRRLEVVTESRAGVVDAADAERRRIERDLHDGVQQRLTSLAVHLGIARTTVADDTAGEAVTHAHTEVKAALADLRDLVRGLHPAVLDDRGLDAALSGVAARAPIPVGVEVALPGRAPRDVEAVAYFVVSEALTNAIRHAAASSVDVRVAATATGMSVTVTDDGHGGADPDQGSGLRGLVQRVASVDGRLRIDSPAGGPTVLRGELPCAW